VLFICVNLWQQRLHVGTPRRLVKIRGSPAELFDYLRAGDGGVGLLGVAESKHGSIAKASPLVTLVVPRLAMVEMKNYF
jgi:hypothetical protein